MNQILSPKKVNGRLVREPTEAGARFVLKIEIIPLVFGPESSSPANSKWVPKLKSKLDSD